MTIFIIVGCNNQLYSQHRYHNDVMYKSRSIQPIYKWRSIYASSRAALTASDSLVPYSPSAQDWIPPTLSAPPLQHHTPTSIPETPGPPKDLENPLSASLLETPYRVLSEPGRRLVDIYHAFPYYVVLSGEHVECATVYIDRGATGAVCFQRCFEEAC